MTLYSLANLSASSFFLIWLIYGGLGFSVDGVWGLLCGAFWVFWVGALYINIKH